MKTALLSLWAHMTVVITGMTNAHFHVCLSKVIDFKNIENRVFCFSEEKKWPKTRMYAKFNSVAVSNITHLFSSGHSLVNGIQTDFVRLLVLFSRTALSCRHVYLDSHPISEILGRGVLLNHDPYITSNFRLLIYGKYDTSCRTYNQAVERTVR